MPNTVTETNVEPFRRHYEDLDSQWGNHSGPGSDSFYTADYRTFISKFVRLNSIGSVIDIGCGDWQSSRFIDFGGARYLGLDVLESVIDRNVARYTTDYVEFKIMPDDLSLVPSADLLIMKDVLQHLPNDAIMSFYTNVFPKFKYCLLTNSYRKLDTPQNIDIETGSFRCLDLTAPPFSFSGVYLSEFGSAVWERIRLLLLSA